MIRHVANRPTETREIVTNHSRRRFVSAAALTCCGPSILQSGSAAASSSATYAMTPLRNNVGYFRERGGTVGWLVGDEGIVVVDTQFPDCAAHLLAEIARMSTRRIDLLVNTHHHGNHCYGNIAFRGRTARILAHENSKKRQIEDYERYSLWRRMVQIPAQVYPDTTFTDEYLTRIGRETVAIKHLGPAHTDGDALVHFQNANIVHCGDLLYHRTPPLVDKKAGASFHNWIAVLSIIRRTYDKSTLFIAGHAAAGLDPVCTLADLGAFEEFMLKTLATVRTAVKQGKSKEEITGIRSIAGAGEWTGEMLQSALAAAYTELSER